MDAYREEYENYEPELKVWPFILLGFLVPMVPFICNILLYREGITTSYNFLWNLFNYVLIATSYFVTANVVRTSRGSWLLAIIGGLYFVLVLCFWGYYKLKGIVGYPLGVPFVIAEIPSFLYVLSYSFFAKRSRLPAWGTSTLVSLLIGIIFCLYLFFSNQLDSANDVIYFIYSSCFVLLALFTLFVTKRSEAAPWYIDIILVFLVFISIVASPGFAINDPVDSIVIFILKTIATSYSVWIMVSLCFIYAGLGMKSCFKNLNKREDDGIEELIVKQSTPGYAPRPSYQDESSRYQNNSNYAFPSPDIDRFSKRDKYERRFDDYDDFDRSSYSKTTERYSENRDRYPDDRRTSPRYHDDRKYYDDRYQNRREYSDRYEDEYDEYIERRPEPPRRRDSRPYEEDRYYDDSYERRPIREREERPLLDRDNKRSYNNDSYRNSKPSSDDKWYDLLRGGIDQDEYESRGDRNHRDSRW